MLITRDRGLARIIVDFFLRKDILIMPVFDDSQVLRLIRKHQPDLVIVDNNISRIEPEYLCRGIKRRFPLIPIIFLADKPNPDDLSKYIKIPIQDFLIKPLNLDILHLRILSNIQKELGNKPIYLNGAIRMNELTKEVLVDGKLIQLTPREYRLLRALIINKGKVLSRTQLLDQVWGFDSYVVDRSVDVYIGYLRNKLRKALNKQYIKTLRSFGYMMIDYDSQTSQENSPERPAKD